MNNATWRHKNPEKAIVISIRSRCKREKIECNIDYSDIKIPEKCPILGLDLYWTLGTITDNTPSVDRIDCTKGYIKGNVWVISKKANTMKNNATKEELREFCLRCLSSMEQGTLSTMS